VASNKPCEACGKLFSRATENGKSVYWYRKNCFDCTPLQSRRADVTKTDMALGQKKCLKCGETKPVSEFYLKKKGHPEKGWFVYCIVCETTRRTADQTALKQEAVDYKGGKCVICDYDKCLGALAFHHLDPSKKDFAISHRIGYNGMDEAMIAELDKCILLCCRCHAETHAGIHDIQEYFHKNPKKEKAPRVIIRLTGKDACGCGKEKMVQAIKCLDCELRTRDKSKQTKADWPSLPDLIAEIQNTNFVVVARRLGVTDNSVRKHLTTRGIDIKTIKPKLTNGWNLRKEPELPVTLEVDGKVITL